MSSARKSRAIFALIITLVLSVVMMIGVQLKETAFATDTVKTVSEVVYTMKEGASIYNDRAGKLGIRFGASMSESDYQKLMNNVGEGKLYSSVKFGVVIAPKSYEDENDGKNALNYENLFGENAIYDWAEWNGSEWVYDNQSGKTRVINIESKELTVEDGKASNFGSITTIRPENLLNEFKGVAYIIAEKNEGGIDKTFAVENDNVRTPVYVAQLRQQNNENIIKTLDEETDAEYIAELNEENDALTNAYLTADVIGQDAKYTVEHYYAKPNGGYFLYETTTETGKINATLTPASASGSEIEGVAFDSANANNQVSQKLYAQNKSVVKVYYTVAYGKDADNTEKIYDISSASDYALDDGIIAVYTADMEKISSEDKIANAKIVEMGKGERDLYVLTANGFEKYSTIMATHVISTANEFVDFFNAYSGEHANNGTTNWYAVVVNDIDLTKKTKSFTGKTTDDYYNGVFNGLGHVIDNLTIAGNQGLFGYTGSNVDIKNFALTNVVAGEKAILSNYLAGKATNIYVQGSASSDPGLNRPVFYLFTHTAAVSNVIANISGSFTYAFKFDSDKYGKIENSYAIGATNLTDKNGTMTNCALYESVDEFYTAQKDNLSTWSKYWKNTAFGFYFGSAVVALNSNIEVDETKTTKYLKVVEVGTSGAVSATKDHLVDLKAMLNATPEVVMIDDVKVESADTITLNSGDYEYGKEYTILFGAGETVIAQPFMFATHVIEDEDDFVAFIDSYTGASYGSNPNGTATWYVVLSTDLSMEGKKFNLNHHIDDYFGGTFNGLGHTISDFTTATTPGTQGVFGRIYNTAVIENIAFTNFVAGTEYILAGEVGATIRNVYIQGSSSFKDTRGVMKLTNNAKVSNVVINVSPAMAGFVYSDSNASYQNIITKSYVIGAQTYAGKLGWVNDKVASDDTYAPVGSKVHEDASDLLGDAAFIADISTGATNGWAKYWNLTGNQNDGYTLKFGNTTIGTTVK